MRRAAELAATKALWHWAVLTAVCGPPVIGPVVAFQGFMWGMVAVSIVLGKRR